MANEKKIPTWGYEIIKEGEEEVMKINLEDWPYLPSIEDNSTVMSMTMDKLVEVPSTSRIVFAQRKHYTYDYEQTQLLNEIAILYNRLMKQKRALSLGAMGTEATAEDLPRRYNIVQDILFNLLKSDPLGAYVELKRVIRDERLKLKKIQTQEEAESEQIFIDLLQYIHDLLDQTRLINIAKTNLAGYHLGDRSLYATIFKPTITPDFLFTRLMAQMPLNSEELDVYTVGNSEINILSIPEDIKYIYHLNPPEFQLSEDKYMLLDYARQVLSEHQPREEEFLEPEKMRITFLNIGKDLLQELAENKGLDLEYEELNELAQILVRYTVGFGLIEVLLQDEKVQDITINGPIGQTPMFLVHQDYDECVTNIIPSKTDAQSWASKFRMLSGRPLDEANPILDTELKVPGARARVAIVQNPLNPYGLSYTFRRHRDKPWTLPLFIKNRMLNPLSAGLLSFLIDGARTMLIAGTRSSGKTSLLGAALVEIMRKYRIITVEDSVTGDGELIIRRGRKINRVEIGKLIDMLIEENGCWYNLSGHEILGNPEKIEILSMNNEGRMQFSRITKFIRHKVEKPLYEITTRTGRKLKITGDHSLFWLGRNGKIEPVRTTDLKVGDHIATPRKIKLNHKKTNKITILSMTNRLESGYLLGDGINRIIGMYKKKIKKMGRKQGYSKSTVDRWLRKGILPSKIALRIPHNKLTQEDVFYKPNINSKALATTIKLDKDFLNFIGLWLADGCYDKNSVIISAEEEEQKIIHKIAEKFNLTTKKHSDQFSLMLNSKTLKFYMQDILELKGDAYTKRIPGWVYNLSKEQIGWVLEGLFSGDGCVSDKEIVIPLSSSNLLKDIQTLLLGFEITLRIGKKRKDKTYRAAISNHKSWIKFQQIGFLQKRKKERLNLLCNKKSTHDTSDIIPLMHRTKLEIREQDNNFNYRDYIHGKNNVGREQISCVAQLQLQQPVKQNIEMLSNTDILWDEIAQIKLIQTNEQYLYDISVPESESFVCNNIIAHNTLELPTEALRQLGYNIQPLKVRSALTTGGAEIPADEGIRTSLRMGDSSLIVGEIRSKEAFALYEAMRIGALANVVAGTIHGDSPYGVFDRVVNDLQVPRTSFKATDIIVIANPIKSPDGLHKWRRCMSITEVRKHWEDDPLRERGFVDLMKYNSKKDTLEPTEDLINGDSDILKTIAGNVKDWVGNWPAVWDNVMLRAATKEKLVNYAEKQKMPDLLEAEFVILSNDQFHRISGQVREEVGSLESKTILYKWDEWLRTKIKERKGF
jgi:type IV secretory pathway ATPase VirB11/archaellum biosynthesis ATPase/intein/homing endonuclease